jgi:SAM-dependent methyltransferase
MKDPLRQLYGARAYPAMSHPLSDPAVSAVAALLGGLHVKQPSAARILEIGCSSGHNLIPLAMRWPEARLVGIDFSLPAIEQARELAAIAGVQNLEFHAADLREFRHEGEPYDIIIAHGFFSWVPDEVKTALLGFCARHLAPAGIATISFNAEPGWRARFPVIHKTRAILQAGAQDEMAALALLREVTDADSPDIAIIDDMMAKGPSILPFDDFAPVNDPWPLEKFVGTAAAAGLRWLGESDPATNEAAGDRTFHSAVLCRSDASLESRATWSALERIFMRSEAVPNQKSDPVVDALSRNAPRCVSLEELQSLLPHMEPRHLGQCIIAGIRSGCIHPRIEAVSYDSEPPEKPRLNPFRLECARRKLPLVDAWHRPCSFPDCHFDVLARMDGSLNQHALADFAANHCAELDFTRWLRHLSWRGVFV